MAQRSRNAIGVRILMTSFISLYYKVRMTSITVFLSHCFPKYTVIIYHCKVGENLISSYKDITQETHTIYSQIQEKVPVV